MIDPLSTGIGATIGALWEKINSWITSIKRLIIVDAIIFNRGNADLPKIVWENLLEDFVPLPGNLLRVVYPKVYSTTTQEQPLKYVLHGLFRHRHKPLIIHADYYNDKVKLSYLKGTLDLTTYMVDRKTTKFPLKQFNIIPLKGENRKHHEEPETAYYEEPSTPLYPFQLQNWDNTPFKGNLEPINNSGYILNEELTKVEQELYTWADAEEWYISKDIPWKRGYLLYGDPGTGKSAFVRHIGITFGLPIYVLDLQSFTSNTELMQAIKSVNGLSILLIEDVDSVFKGRELISKNTETNLTFDGLLNALDGVNQFNGLIFITTNHIENLDPALIRPGRVDRQINIKLPDYSQRLQIISKILDEEQEQYAIATEGKTCAEIQELCVSRALKLKWNEQ
jgi:hypothetical protein